jgi:ankyrin repeat protein
MSISTVSNELLLLIAQQLQSQKDLNALIKVNHRFYHLLKHLLFRYNLRHQNGDGILRAAKLGSIPTVAQFIKEGYRVKGQPVHDQEHLPDRFGNQVPCSCHLEHPILDAAEYGHSALVKYLLSAGSEPDLENNLGETPMHLAAKNGFLSVIKVLFSGSTLLMYNDTIFTLAPIKEAALRGQTQVVEYLLSSSSNPSDYASSSLPFAAVSGDIALVSMILGYGADINHRYIERHVPRKPINPHGGRGHEATALSVAATYGHLTLVNFLLNNGSNIDLKTGFRSPTLWKTPLHLAVGKGHDEVIKTFLAHGADVDEEHLHEAILQSNKKPLEMLLAKYGVENCRSNLLELAAEVGDAEICQMLLDKGFDQEKAVVKAIEFGQDAVVTLLLANGLDPDLPTLRDSAINLAISCGQSGIMELLLRHGAHIYPENLKLLDLYAPEHIVALAKQFPVHSLPKREMYPSVYISPPEARIEDIDYGSTRRRLW